uniref:Uncharacterized protein n=1 Tax=Periophthalmus magnuspinnatus TaxID=409849 RepID=A0A3B3ZBS9_9GOBI
MSPAESMRELFLDEGIEDRVLDDLRHLWESKIMQSKAMEDFRKNNINSSNFVLQLPASYTQNEQEITETVATFSLPAGLTYPVQIPAGVTLQTASGQLYKVNVPVVVTQTPAGQQSLPHPAQKVPAPAPKPQPAQVRVNTAPVHEVAPSTVSKTTISNPTPVPIPLQSNLAPIQEAIPPQQREVPEIIDLDLDYSALSDIVQLDGTADNSEDEEVAALEENDFLGIINAEAIKALQEGDDPLNSGDDVIEQDIPDLFDTDNVIVCQYDKIHRSKNRWKFHLKDGVITYGGKDFVFSKAVGEAEW